MALLFCLVLRKVHVSSDLISASDGGARNQPAWTALNAEAALACHSYRPPRLALTRCSTRKLSIRDIMPFVANTAILRGSVSRAPVRLSAVRPSSARAAAVRPVTMAAAAADPKIRIKLKSFDVGLLAESVESIQRAVDSTGARLSGPVNLPVRIRRYCVLRSPHVNKDSREHFESRTHSRLMDIKDISAETIDRLMILDLPAGVDVQVCTPLLARTVSRLASE
jgi:small subunit ribosomal protein S10